MIKARVIVTEVPELCRRDLELTCIGDHISYCFWSGIGNKIVVQTNEKNELVVTTVRQTWLMFLKDVIESNWNKFVGLFFRVVGSITGRNVPFVQFTFNAVIPLSWAGNGLPAIEDNEYYQIV